MQDTSALNFCTIVKNFPITLLASKFEIAESTVQHWQNGLLPAKLVQKQVIAFIKEMSSIKLDFACEDSECS